MRAIKRIQPLKNNVIIREKPLAEGIRESGIRELMKKYSITEKMAIRVLKRMEITDAKRFIEEIYADENLGSKRANVLHLCIGNKNPKKRLESIREIVKELRKIIEEYPELETKKESVINLCIKAKDPVKLAKNYSELMKKVKHRERYWKTYYEENYEKIQRKQKEWRDKIRRHYLDMLGRREGYSRRMETKVLAVDAEQEKKIFESEIRKLIMKTKGLNIAEKAILADILEQGGEAENIKIEGLTEMETAAVVKEIFEKLRKNPELRKILEEL